MLGRQASEKGVDRLPLLPVDADQHRHLDLGVGHRHVTGRCQEIREQFLRLGRPGQAVRRASATARSLSAFAHAVRTVSSSSLYSAV
jgi:hypothetical protein